MKYHGDSYWDMWKEAVHKAVLVKFCKASVLLNSNWLYSQENDRLKTEVYEKSSKIEAQNEKIADLLQRNQS